MKLGLKSLALTLAVALLCVPVAFAKGGNGNGHGKPSWAGAKEHGNGHGKPAWAGQGKGHQKQAQAEKKAKKEKQQTAGAEDDSESEELDLDDLNPAWYCKTLEAMMDEADADAAEGGAEPGEFSSFDTEFGENDNKRNSFGKCVSRRAQGEDLSGALPEQEPAEACDDAAPEEGEGDDGGSEGTEEDTGDGEETSEEGSEECQEDGGEDSAEDQELGEEDGTNESAAFARALVSFVRL